MLENEIKILLLGTGESGKSTFIKQLQLIYQQGFDEETQLLFRDAIIQNVIKHTEGLLEIADVLDLQLQKKNTYIYEEFARLNIENEESTELTSQMIKCIEELWSDPALKEAYEERYAFQIPDTANLYLDKVREIGKTDYVPSNQDILGCRIPTTGINVIKLKVKKNIWKIVDVGGQRNERRKWIHQFEDAFFLIYIIAINEYNQFLYEDEKENRLQESLKLFEKILNNPFFRHTNCILLFNKMDLFKEKIQKYALNKCFPEYTGGNNNKLAEQYVKKMFLSKGQNKNRELFIYDSCAIDTNNIDRIFQKIQESVISSLQNVEENW